MPLIIPIIILPLLVVLDRLLPELPQSLTFACAGPRYSGPQTRGWAQQALSVELPAPG